MSASVELRVPTLDDVRAARERIAPHLPPTPLLAHGALSELVGTEILVKHENHLPTGAFKVRGGVNLVSRLGEDERRSGVVTASTGNHGQSIAFAGGRFGVRAVVCVPEDANPVKLAAMKRLGAERSSTGASSTRRASTASRWPSSTAIATCTPGTSPT